MNKCVKLVISKKVFIVEGHPSIILKNSFLDICLYMYIFIYVKDSLLKYVQAFETHPVYIILIINIYIHDS